MSEEEQTEYAYPCPKFKMALDASFQECGTCGWSKEQHRPIVRKRLRKIAVRSRKASAVMEEKKEPQEKALEPCRIYKRDINAAAYDVCICGWNLEEHKAANKERKRKKEEEKERLEAEANQKSAREVAMEQGVACDKFEVDVQNETGGYGVCLCGKTREDHFEIRQQGSEYLQIRRRLTEPKPFV